MKLSQERQKDEIQMFFDTVSIELNTRKTVLQRWILQYLSTFIHKNQNQQSRMFLGKTPNILYLLFYMFRLLWNNIKEFPVTAKQT